VNAKKFGPAEFARAASVSRETLAKLVEYQQLLEKWQARINLIGPATLPEVWERHFLDSAQLYPLLPGSGHAVLYDLGSGAGFPGLVLAVMAAGGGRKLDVHLVESDKRKAAFLAEVCRVLGLARAVTIHTERAANLKIGRLPKADIVTARALAPLTELLEMAEKLLGFHGICLFPKGARVDNELTQARKRWKLNAERLPSRSDSSGTILRISDLRRA
jgi:16S rRNA (guanine527-N7)-methyltransferase